MTVANTVDDQAWSFGNEVIRADSTGTGHPKLGSWSGKNLAQRRGVWGSLPVSALAETCIIRRQSQADTPMHPPVRLITPWGLDTISF